MKKYLKSIHIRYMLTFMAIMIITILILGIIIASIVSNFSLDILPRNIPYPLCVRKFRLQQDGRIPTSF